MAGAKTGIKSGSEKPEAGVFEKLSTNNLLVVSEVGKRKDEVGDECVCVIARDEKGFYATKKSYAGTSILDPYRQYRREILLGELTPETLENYGVEKEIIEKDNSTWVDEIREKNNEPARKK